MCMIPSKMEKVLHIQLVAWTVAVLISLISSVEGFMELPKFEQMRVLYPGYYLYGGRYRDSDILNLIGGDHSLADRSHNTASIRLSVIFNKYGGHHKMGLEPIFLSKRGKDSYSGNDGQQYIFRNTAFGPYLAGKYGNPVTSNPNQTDSSQTMNPFMGKQGVVRLVSYHRHHAGGHVALWDCDHFHQTRDFTQEIQLISVEFWEAQDSYCPPVSDVTVPPPHMVAMRHKVKLVARHNMKGRSGGVHPGGRMPKSEREQQRGSSNLWMQ